MSDTAFIRKNLDFSGNGCLMLHSELETMTMIYRLCMIRKIHSEASLP